MFMQLYSKFLGELSYNIGMQGIYGDGSIIHTNKGLFRSIPFFILILLVVVLLIGAVVAIIISSGNEAGLSVKIIGATALNNSDASILVESNGNGGRAETFLSIAAFVIAIVAAGIAVTQTFIGAQVDHEIMKVSYVEKQLTELYLPMKKAADLIEWDLANFDVTSIHETSYLASGELGKCIDEFIRCNTIPVTFRVDQQNDVYKKVRAALEADIPKLKKELDYYLRI